MKSKKWIVIVLFLLVCFSLVYSFMNKHKKQDVINTNVNVIVDLDNTYNVEESESIEEETITYAPPSDPMATIGSSEFDEKVIDSSVIDEQLDTTTENVDNNIEFDTTLNETNFADNFIKLLDNDLSNYDIGVLPITENLYSNLDKGIILEDAYNNGYIILRIGLNTEDNTFMCLIRSINQRTYLKGTLIDGKLDTIISTVVQ